MDILDSTERARKHWWLGYVLAVGVTLSALGLRFLIGDVLIDYPYLVFFAPILFASFIGGAGPGLLAAILAAILAQYYMVGGGGSLLPQTPGQWIGMSGFLITATIIIALMQSVISSNRQQSVLRRKLQELNGQLGDLVGERTEALKAEMANHNQSQAQLRQLQKMETIGSLTGGIAHDFNNMLAVVIGSLDMIDRRIRDGKIEEATTLVGNAREGAKRAALLTARLLAFARQQPLSPELIDANKLVGGMSEMLRRTLGETVQVETVFAGGLWPTYADMGQLENAVLNLAVNARDAMPSGGKLTIETANAELDDRYARLQGDIKAGQYVMISVTDTGTGMSSEVIEKAFDPFYTTKGLGKGTGLGLSQVYGYVKQTGGHIRIYSEIDRGTTFKIYLPRFLGEVAKASVYAEPGADLPHAEGSKIVLVVEDDEQVRTMTVDALRDLGYIVVQASSGKEALQQLELQPRVDLLFTDIVMPEMNGKQLAELVIEKRPGLRVLYTTGYTRNAIVHNGVLDHGVSLLTKPFNLEALALKLRDVLK